MDTYTLLWPKECNLSSLYIHCTKYILLVIGYQLGLHSLLWPILLANRYFTAFDLSRNSKISIIYLGYHGEIFFKHFFILRYIFLSCLKFLDDNSSQVGGCKDMVIFHTNLKGNLHIMGCSGWGNYYKNYHYNLSFN